MPLYCDLLFLCPVAIEIIQSKCFNTIKNTVNIFQMKVFKQKWLDVFKWIEVTYLNTLIIKKKQNPVGAVNTNRVSNHNVKRGNTMAMYKSTQTHPKFKWRFFSCQQSRYFTVEARSEQEARSMLPDAPCLFSARIRQGVNHV
ncbi:host cell division inhibitor Icd-like protein [Morganella morganii]|nr:host cell division inhibitor Icd-like protein [Morganella morganii]